MKAVVMTTTMVVAATAAMVVVVKSKWQTENHLQFTTIVAAVACGGRHPR